MSGLIQRFVQSEKDYVVIIALASGLSPLIYLYTRNYSLVNSWTQFGFFVMLFLGLPLLLFLIISKLSKAFNFFKSLKARVFSILNVSIFMFLIIFITYGLDKKKILLGGLCVAIALGFLAYKHLKKIVVVQLILAGIGLGSLLPIIYDVETYSYEWQNQPDNILDVQFKKTPNIYVLQPDGYVDFEVLNKPHYSYENEVMKTFLNSNSFKVYPNFRSNYTSTLTSNSSLFSMKHHYYGGHFEVNEFHNARKIIVGKNPVLDILKKNNYKTNLILDVPYLLVNRSQINFDHCNISHNEIGYLSRGFEFKKNTTQDLIHAIEQNVNKQNFYFVREPNPSHVQTRQSKSLGKDKERLKYIERLEESNIWITNMISEIIERDPESIIVLSSDHGGFVGYDYTQQSFSNVDDEVLVNSIFSSILAIRWSSDIEIEYENNLKSSVNLFRVLFSYLAEDKRYLEVIEEDASYGRINKKSASGVYKLINDNGEVGFNKISE